MTFRRRRTDKPSAEMAPQTSPPNADPFAGLTVDFDPTGALDEAIREGDAVFSALAEEQIRRDLEGFPEWAVLEILRERGPR